MIPGSSRRIARVRPLVPESTMRPSEQYFVTNDCPDFSSAEGRSWTVISSPFPESLANAESPARTGWTAGQEVSEDTFRFLAPSVPANVLGMAHNTGPSSRALPPQAFHKAATSVIGPGDTIELPEGGGQVDPEAELTIVVGRKARGLTLKNARAAVLGYTIGNDVTSRDHQKTDQLWISAKSQDTFTPVGPWLVTDLDDSALSMGITHNGRTLGAGSSADLGWKVDEILVYLTSFMTLHPGDLVLTGFPAESVPLQPGDTVTCQVEGIGELSNPVGVRDVSGR
ncbi:fumarylacetoacetate hydrolase family protein [Arthrobacter sp.]|uniref:fumarylacetoacetate hydrolase family protein n=1 Tax=Arthrobacter sp. TaxID=1667 RepID=UPI002810BFC2|nr:fumarylacetoacetate hydrolase family protein [Arthrobacter sp.]